MLMMRELKTPFPLVSHTVGPSIDEGPLPLAIYFAFSSQESLSLAPYNAPVTELIDPGLRVLSFSLPFHDPPHDRFQAITNWSERMRAGDPLLETYLDSISKAVQWLIDQSIAEPGRIGALGLSRGGFIATHLALRSTAIPFVLGYAPVTDLALLQEFAPHLDDVHFRKSVEQLSLMNHLDDLLHLRGLRFYIGNRDERVSTDGCYRFIRALVERAHERGARKCKIDLFITPSIGHKGHGTAPHHFIEGARWMKQQLLRE